MKLCLDTSAYSWLMRGREPLRVLLESASEVALPVIVLGELYAGFERGSRQRENKESLTLFLQLPGVVRVPVDEGVAERYGRLVCELLQAGTPIPANDIWIAATAMECGARLVTYDAHFEKIPGLMILAP